MAPSLLANDNPFLPGGGSAYTGLEAQLLELRNRLLSIEETQILSQMPSISIDSLKAAEDSANDVPGPDVVVIPPVELEVVGNISGTCYGRRIEAHPFSDLVPIDSGHCQSTPLENFTVRR